MNRAILVHRLVLLSVVTIVTASTAFAADDHRAASADPRWAAIHQASLPVLSTASQEVLQSDRATREAIRLPELDAAAVPQPSIVVVGFTGGLERHDSSVSGIVRIRHGISQRLAGTPAVAVLTSNNFRWRQAATDVSDLARASRHARDDGQGAAGGPLAPLPQPLIVVYGHSWGGGSITTFARALRDGELEVSLAMYIDAFTVRNPKVPDNVRYAVNVYQRTGLLRGLPLRGKRRLVLEAPDATVMLGSYRLTPDTDHFGWNWNIVQPLLYRHHHRISHDVRLQWYLLEIISAQLQLLAGTAEPAPGGAPTDDVAGRPGNPRRGAAGLCAGGGEPSVHHVASSMPGTRGSE